MPLGVERGTECSRLEGSIVTIASAARSRSGLSGGGCVGAGHRLGIQSIALSRRLVVCVYVVALGERRGMGYWRDRSRLGEDGREIC